jgi:hypothetical protein
MNKRSAVLMALGLTAALVVGGIAVAAGSGPASGQASSDTTAAAAKPIVKTRTHTVTIHRKADGNGGAVVNTSNGTSGGGADDGSLHDALDDHGDDGFEAEDANDDHGDDGNSGPGSVNSGPGSENSGPGGGDD